MANVDPSLAYAQDEDPYLYCPVCGRKEYRLALVGSQCNGSNPPSNAVYCPGILTASQVRNVSVDAIDPFASG